MVISCNRLNFEFRSCNLELFISIKTLSIPDQALYYRSLVVIFIICRICDLSKMLQISKGTVENTCYCFRDFRDLFAKLPKICNNNFMQQHVNSVRISQLPTSHPGFNSLLVYQLQLSLHIIPCLVKVY